jgi:hypothetical protein
MDKDFMQYVYARCDKALGINVKYAEIQDKCIEAIHSNNLMEYGNLTAESETLVQEICYIQGFNDAMQLILNAKQ